jgi:ribonucleoside-diphosphate reductase alpha chain
MSDLTYGSLCFEAVPTHPRASVSAVPSPRLDSLGRRSRSQRPAEASAEAGECLRPKAKSLVDYIFKWLGSKFMTAEEKQAIGIVSRDSSSTGPIAVTQQEVVSRSAISEEHKLAFENQADAPACHECGSIMVRSGSCYRCTNCGATSGCS